MIEIKAVLPLIFIVVVIMCSTGSIAGIAWKYVYGNYTTTGATVYVSSDGYSSSYEASINKYGWIDETIRIRLFIVYQINFTTGETRVYYVLWPPLGCADDTAYKAGGGTFTAKIKIAYLDVWGYLCDYNNVDGKISIYAYPGGPIPTP